jgi:hypothetical protein
VVATLDDPRLTAVSAALGRLRPTATADGAAPSPIPDGLGFAAIALAEQPVDEVEEVVETAPWEATFDGTLLPRAPLHRSRMPSRLSRCFKRPKRRGRRWRSGAALS